MILKANDYAKDFMEMYKVELKFRDAKEALIDPVILICRRLLIESREIFIIRKAKSDLAWEAIIKEQDRKWKAIVRRLPSELSVMINPNAFIKVWEHFKNEVDKNDQGS